MGTKLNFGKAEKESNRREQSLFTRKFAEQVVTARHKFGFITHDLIDRVRVVSNSQRIQL